MRSILLPKRPSFLPVEVRFTPAGGVAVRLDGPVGSARWMLLDTGSPDTLVRQAEPQLSLRIGANAKRVAAHVGLAGFDLMAFRLLLDYPGVRLYLTAYDSAKSLFDRRVPRRDRTLDLVPPGRAIPPFRHKPLLVPYRPARKDGL